MPGGFDGRLQENTGERSRMPGASPGSESMSAFPGSPRLLKGGIVVLDPVTAAIQSVINLQYNPDTLTRSLQIKGVTGEAGDRTEALRLKGPPVETIKVDAEIHATDLLEASHP